MKKIDRLLSEMTMANASDLHLKIGRVPMIRVAGVLHDMKEPVITLEVMKSLISETCSEKDRSQFEHELELDTAYQPVSIRDRFRVNVFQRLDVPGMVMRRLPRDVKSLDEWGFRSTLKDLISHEYGLVLVTGPTGSGKSTTLAAMIRELNETKTKHIITIEDPIEYVFDDIKCIITQRQVGNDTFSFSEALRRALRQDPNVIVIGEMRDCDTMRIAAQAAETGHLVLSTLHTNDAKQSIDRIINTFPPDEQFQSRLKLSTVLRGIISQSLIPRCDQEGVICVQEIMVCTDYIRELIKKGEIQKIDTAIADAASVYGMQAKNKSIFEAWREGKISENHALEFSTNPADLNLLMRTAKFEDAKRSPPTEASPRDALQETNEEAQPSPAAADGSSPPGGRRAAEPSPLPGGRQASAAADKTPSPGGRPSSTVGDKSSSPGGRQASAAASGSPRPPDASHDTKPLHDTGEKRKRRSFFRK